MTYHLGVDLGTTYTAAAVHRDGKVEVIGLGLRAPVIPSVVFRRDDDEILTGDAAVRRALTEPDRVAREFKRRIGDTTPLLLGGSPYSAEALSAELLRWVVEAVSRQEDGRPGRIVLCHPANWGEYKKGLLEQAVQIADLRDVRFVTEPEAAAVYYASQERIEPGTTVAAYDLGGGTFDATVLRKDEGGWTVLGDPQGIERLGGIDFDEALFQHVVAQLDGKVNELDLDDPVATAALNRLRQDVIEAKEALSSDTQTAITVVLPNVQTEVRVTRSEFEDMIRPPLQNTLGSLRRALESAGVAAEAISKVLLVGGSSRIPLVAQMVGGELGRPVGVDTHPKHAVPLGAALLAAQADEPTAVAVDAGTESAAPSRGTPVPEVPPGPPPSDTPSGRAPRSEPPAPQPPPARVPRSARRLPRRGVTVVAVAVVAALVAVVVTRGGGDGDGDDVVVDDGGLAVVASMDLGGQVEGLVVAEGAVWASDSSAARLVEVDVESNELATTVSLDSAPAGMASTAGALWVALPDAASVVKVDIGSGEVTDTIDVAGGPRTVTAGEGFVWVLDGSNQVSRLDTVDLDSSPREIDLSEDVAPSDLAAGEGALWIGEGFGRVLEVDLFDLAVSGAHDTGGEGIDGLAVGFGGVWMGLEGGAVGRIDPRDVPTSAGRVEVEGEPRALALGGGAVWVAHRDVNGISRIDPDALVVTDTVELGFVPREIAFGEGSLWAVSIDGRMARIDAP